jgi:hypothetical protein
MSNHATAVREACLNSNRIDTHAHLHEPYGSPGDRMSNLSEFKATMDIIDSRVTAEGCRILYDAEMGAFFRDTDAKAIAGPAAELRAKGSWEAIAHGLDVAGIDKQIAFCGFQAENSRPFASTSGGRVAYLAYIDQELNSHGQWPCPDYADLEGTYYSRLCDQFGPQLSYTDYLNALDAGIDGWRSFGIVGLKTAIAYTSGLSIGKPSLDEARAAFSRGSDMSEQDFRTAHDYAFHHILHACMRNGLPVVIHTGFQIWGHSDLSISNPMLLHNIIADPDYRDCTFILLHGGNPYTGETAYLAGMFENVNIDFTWIGWMNPARFRGALAEWLEVVPHTRMCWGSDSGNPETIVGTGSVMRRVIADALEMSIADRTIDERYALEFVENVYQTTPKRLFGV